MTNINDTSVVKLEITAIDSSGPAIDSAKKRLGDLDSHTGSIVDKMKSQWVAYSAAIATAGYAIKKMILDIANAGEEMLKMSKMTGISTENLSVLKYQAQLSETSIDELTTGMRFFSRALTGMNDEGKDTTRLLREMGVTARDPYEALMQASKAISQYEDGAAKATLMMELFGRSGVGLTSMLNELASAESQARIEAERAGLIWSKEAAEQADRFNDNITKLKANIGGLAQTIGNILIPTLNELFDLLDRKKGIFGAESRLNDLERDIKNYKEILATGKDRLLGTSMSAATLENMRTTLARMEAERQKILDQFYTHAGKGALGEDKKKPAPIVSGKALSGISEADKRNIKWLEGIMKESEEYQKELEKRKKMDGDYWDYKMKLFEDIDALADKHMEEEIKRQEELNRRKLALDEECYQMKKQAYENMWANQFSNINQVGGEMGKGLGMMAGGLKGMTDIQQGYDPYTEEMTRLAEHWAQRLDYSRSVKASEQQIEAEHQAVLIAMDQMTAQQRLSMYQNFAGGMAGAMLALANTGSGIAKAAFIAYKAFAITEATISTYKAAQDAYAWGNKWGGPAIGAILAAIAVAAGLARVKAIMAQQPGGGAATAAAPSGGGGYSYSQPTTPSWEREEPKAPSKTINVVIYGNVLNSHDELARTLLPSINKAIEDGVQ